MKRRFVTMQAGPFRRSAARGMARAGFPAWMLVACLRIKREAAEAALFREAGR